MGSIQKYVNALFLFFAATAWLLTRHYTEVVIGYFQLSRKIGGATDFIEHGVPVLVALLVFMILRKNRKVLNFCTDSVSELIKVIWPNQRDVTIGTIVVIITVLVSGAALGVLDMGLRALVSTVIGA